MRLLGCRQEPVIRATVTAEIFAIMERDYDIFEQLPDGGVLWRGHVQGLDVAIAKLRELGSKSSNEFFAMHMRTKDVAARINVSERDLDESVLKRPARS